MFALRCTRKLLARLGTAPASDHAQPTTRLGDWYANLLRQPGGQLVLFVNERSLLPVLVWAAPASALLQRFRTETNALLLRLGLPHIVVGHELQEMSEARICKTASRRVLGTMTDFAFLLSVPQRRTVNLEDLTLQLADAPCSPIGMRRPMDVAVELLRAGE